MQAALSSSRLRWRAVACWWSRIVKYVKHTISKTPPTQWGLNIFSVVGAQQQHHHNNTNHPHPHLDLGGGFNPSEKHMSKIGSSLNKTITVTTGLLPSGLLTRVPTRWEPVAYRSDSGENGRSHPSKGPLTSEETHIFFIQHPKSFGGGFALAIFYWGFLLVFGPFQVLDSKKTSRDWC